MSNKQRFDKAVVLGAGGFIGINLVHELVKRGYRTVCFDRQVSEHWPESVAAITGEFSDMPDDLVLELDNALVFHLISSSRPTDRTTGITQEIESDLVSTVNYLEVTHERNNRWIYVSSGGTVYGPSDAKLISEDQATRPICSYGVTKLAIENYLHLYGRLHNLDYVIARLSNPFGPWQHPLRGQGVVMALLHSMITDKQISIWGDGEAVRDYIYIEDAVTGLLSMADKAKSGALYNLASGSGMSVNELVKTTAEVLNLNPGVHYVDSRATDVQYNVLDVSKIYRELAWKPAVSIDDGIVKAANWIKQLSG